MAAKEKLTRVWLELKAHSPFTAGGAVLGILFVLLFKDIEKQNALRLFAVFHPLHVVLSAMVTAALFKLHRKAASFLLILVIGYVGSIGVATLSDCILPYLGQSILGAAIPTHASLHVDSETEEEHAEEAEHVHGPACEHGHELHLHLGFIEEWYLVNPAALLGIALAYFRPSTKMPHAAHILVSTWASASFMLMSSPEQIGIPLLIGMFIALFVAVWLPCCVSDIIFPMMFVRADGVHIGHHGCILCGKKDPAESAEKECPDGLC
jgi:hypothetical protein